MKRRGFLVRAVAGVLGLFGVGKLKAGGRVREQGLCFGCDEWPPLCDRCLPAEDLGGFLVPPDVAKGIWEEKAIVGNTVEATWGETVGFTSEIPGTRHVFTEDGDELI